MTKKFVCIFALSILFLGHSRTASAQKDSAIAEVEILRHEREAKMPYLDKALIRSEINVEKIRHKHQFLNDDKKTLQNLIDRSIRVYTPARAARERIALARRRILAAFRALFPEANFELTDRDGDLSDVAFNSFSYRFKFKQPLFRGGILWNTLLQEKAGLEAAEKEYAASLEDVVSEVAAAYFEYNRTLELLKSQEEALDQMKQYSEISKRKYQEEIISEIEHLNVQSLYSQNQYDYETSKQEHELAKLELQKLLGLELEDEVQIETLYDIKTLIAEKEKTSSGGENTAADADAEADSAEGYQEEEREKLGSLDQLVDLAYQNRPELQVEAAKLESARLEERIRWGEMIPHADATLEFGKLGEALNADDLTPSLEREFRFMLEFSWNVGGNTLGYTHETDQRAPSATQFQAGAGSNIWRDTFSVGILDGLQAYVEAKNAEVERLDQVNQLEKKEKEVIQEVKKTYFDYQKSRIQVKSSLQRVDYRQRLVQLNKHKMDRNEIQISEFLQAQIDLMQELTTLHKALADYYTAKAKLNHAIGIRDYLSLEASHGRTTTA